jgi:molybdopterin-guanine dinucleotide biosynthesis protein A
MAREENSATRVTGVILAGGDSRRMGRNKALLDLDGRPLIAIVAGRLRAVVDELIIAADEAGRYARWADRCVPDVYPEVGTLGGIHTGLEAATHELALIVGCDMPFLDPGVLDWFVKAASRNDGAGPADLVILKHDAGMVEPLHAVYHKSCLPAIKATIESGERCAFAFHDQVRVRYISPDEIAPLDPELLSFLNVNTPEEWRRVLDRRDGRLSPTSDLSV